MIKENKKTYTEDEYIVRMWEKEYLQDLAARFMLAWSNGERREALDKYWVRKTRNQRDASFGENNGFYVGMDEVVRHFVSEYEDECKADLKAFQDAYPDRGYTGGDLGLGKALLHDCTTPLLFIADDGQTARYLCYDVGMEATGKPDGTSKSYFEVALCFIEFIKEGADWRIWHLIYQHDFSIEAGKDYEKMPRWLTPEQNAEFTRHHGNPTKPFDVYDDMFGWEYIYYDMPAPYRTYEEEEGYGPHGKVGKKYYDRIV
jgi:hypothetical protein